uniref:LRRCT domain-containing protein n=1 Tax=Heterorhabditis bacteriophora TaxID=37862 RepID=A0A1I7X9X8_HETBA
MPEAKQDPSTIAALSCMIRTDFFDGLRDLYSIDVQGNRIDNVQSLAWANLPSLSHLDISYNQLQSMPSDVFLNSFIPNSKDRRVIYACGNPWFCNSELEWFRQLLRDNLDIDIEKPGCQAVCVSSPNGCPVENTPLRSVDFCYSDDAQPLTGKALSLVGWIILVTFLLSGSIFSNNHDHSINFNLSVSTCPLWNESSTKKQKDQEIEEDTRVMSSTASMYGGGTSVVDRPYSTVPPVNLDLPAAHTLDDQPSNYFY